MTPVPDRSAHLGSTYRLQMQGIGFAGARQIVSYLAGLGIETLYCSPIFAAAPGSTHGYDVIDPTRLDPALGPAAEFESLLAELSAHEMRLLVDTVPNHMAASPDNAWWWDVLRLGQSSTFAPIFDVDWPAHAGRVLVPTLGCPLRDVLAEVPPEVISEDDGAVIVLDGQRFPLDPASNPGLGVLNPAEAIDLLARQQFRPAFWRLAGDEGNYRRFFDIDGLVGVRVEDSAVVEHTHSLLIQLAGDDRVAGFRIDHVDGLARPGQYLEWLARTIRGGRSTEPAIVVEKILGPDEALPRSWDVDGTTGYEFADLAGALFIEEDPGGATISPFDDLALSAKHEIMAASFGAALDRLARLAALAVEEESPGLDLSIVALRLALVELSAHFDVYRTYLEHTITEEGRGRVDRAAESAHRVLSGESRRALEAIRRGLLGGHRGWREFIERWQQLTGAVMAKGVEDTASYRADRLLGHAEVGSHPDRAPITATEFLAAMAARLTDAPLSLNTTSTHDSKRSEDVRCRLYALTEWRSEWAIQVASWHARHTHLHLGDDPSDLQAAHLLYQTLVALWHSEQRSLNESDCARVQEYMVKALREAKVRSSWSDPDQEYEAALTAMVRQLALSSCEDFGVEAAAWAVRIGHAAATTSLALTVLKTICPGVPDVYQGNELWDFALTDPDNRRPVDFEHRRHLLAELPQPDACDSLLDTWTDGRIKLHVLRTLLALRRQQPELLHTGGVEHLAVSGSLRDHVVALARLHHDGLIVAIVPRLLRRARSVGTFPLGRSLWEDTAVQLPAGHPTQMEDVLSGRLHAPRHSSIAVGDLLGTLPVAVLFGTT